MESYLEIRKKRRKNNKEKKQQEGKQNINFDYVIS